MKNKRILILADPKSSHTIKWCNGIADYGFDVLLFGLSEPDKSEYKSSVKHEYFSFNKELINQPDGQIAKVKYFKVLPRLKKIISDFKPFIMHAHYSSSYGFLGALTGFKPFFVSVWGDDIIKFPRKNILFKTTTKYVLNRADQICATSEYLKKEASVFTSRDISVLPFGVDERFFKSQHFSENSNEIRIGIVKSLEEKYGIANLLYAFRQVSEKIKEKELKLYIAGTGSLLNSLNKLADKLKISDSVNFLGHIPHSKIHEVHSKFDIAVYPSVQEGETFGVSLVESSASGVPVIASNIGGIPEVVVDGETGFLVKPGSIAELTEKLIILVEDAELRKRMGKNGRDFVKSKYSFKNNLTSLLELFNKYL